MTSIEFRNDPLFLRNQFESDGTFEMPKIKKQEIDLENVELVGYDKLNSSNNDQIVHFFLDDYKFEVMWKYPLPRIERLKLHKAVLSPNFSVYTEMPVAMKIYNTFRSRWCGAFLQANDIKVIPTLAWGGPETFWFCFDGIEQESKVAVSTVGVRTEKDLFMQGYNEMLRRLKPSRIICYGKPFEEMKGNVIEVDYAKTNNYEKGVIIKKYFIEYANGVKGMGSASGINTPTWTPKKPDDERFLGNPNSKSEFTKENGDLVSDKYDSQGRAVTERHHSTHNREHTGHTNPHNHIIDWSNGFPQLGPPINYPDGNVPEFKMIGKVNNMCKKSNYISGYSFETIDDFKNSLIYGREVQFKWKNIEYGAFHDYNDGEKAFFICEAHKDDNGTYFKSIDELLDFVVQGQPLKEVITQVEVCWRNI